MAAIIGLWDTSAENMCAEFGPVYTLPEFQHTHATTHAIGLLLHYCFEELGLRRVQWQTSVENQPSWEAAEKMGFTKESVARWAVVLPPTKDVGSKALREGDSRKDCAGAHVLTLSICWDDWTEKRESIEQRMKRKG